MDEASPKYQWGQRVKACIDLVNDGTFPDQEPDAVLANSGEVGEIVNVGTILGVNAPVYLVEFGPNRVIGCMEAEIIPL